MVNRDAVIRLAALALGWADSHSRACEINADSCRFKIANCAPAPSARKPTAEFGHLHHRRLLLLLLTICTRPITTDSSSSCLALSTARAQQYSKQALISQQPYL